MNKTNTRKAEKGEGKQVGRGGRPSGKERPASDSLAKKKTVYVFLPCEIGTDSSSAPPDKDGVG